MSRVEEYIQYHTFSEKIGDIDPSYGMLKYVADRFEITMEQRYWLAFLYSLCYNAATVFYIYNEFPDFAGVDVGRLERWWQANKQKTSFQTDCRWVKSSNLLVPMFMDYKSLVYPNDQEDVYQNLCTLDAEEGYKRCYDYFGQIRYMGRFKLFLLLEAVHVVTNLNIEPDSLPLEEAESSRNGLCFALGRDDLLQGHNYNNPPLLQIDYKYLYGAFEGLLDGMRSRFPGTRIDYWNVETTLCAYKKWHRGKRYPGYYLDRQAVEIQQMQQKVKEGVCWQVLWDYRKEKLDHKYLIEFGADNTKLNWRSNGDSS